MTTDAVHPIVEGYVAAINAADAEAVVALFTDEAVLVNPLGTFTGSEEITGFYRDVVVAGQAVLTIGAVDVEPGPGTTVVRAEVIATSPLDPEAGQLVADDAFHLDAAGRITRLEITYR
ncbi:MAG: nuclear transport factor 2 family protein [Acidimicrobiales bacterium]